VNAYVDRLVLVGRDDFFVQAQSRQGGEFNDRERLLALPLYAAYAAGGGNRVSGFGPPLVPYWHRDCYAIIFPVHGYASYAEGFIYLEAGLDMVANTLRKNSPLPGLAAMTEDGNFISPAGKLKAGGGGRALPPAGGERYRRDGRSFRLDLLPLENAELLLYNEVDVTSLRPDDRDIFYSVAIVIVSSLLAAGGMTMALSTMLTNPVKRIIGRIHKIAENDLSFDPDIEKSADELGQIGRAVNEMSGSIARLLAEMEESFRKRKTAELTLLQARINPHFLYNTLDSIQWMAKIQKNTGIAGLTRSLINLLRNMAVNPGDLISLEEELRILDDYTAIMAIRFMGIFSLKNRIGQSLRRYLVPKLTLQPLVENAIIHGIAPSGIFGDIVLEGRLEGPFLILTVEDSGRGISGKKLKTLLDREALGGGASLNTMGLRNVDERLRLIYGEGAGLSFESEEGKFTRVTVRLGARTPEERHAARTAG
jgi:two-component system sensor histidine kinase YesM